MYPEFPPQPDQPGTGPSNMGPKKVGRSRRWLIGGIAAVALASAAIGGAGATVATRYWDSPSPTAQSSQLAASNLSANPVLTQDSQSVSIASADYQKVGPSVVQIDTSGGGRGFIQQQGTGSGFVIDTSGLIVTNNHVINGAQTITVTFQDGTTRTATVVGTDSTKDLAVLKVDLPKGVPAVTLGNSDQVAVGDPAVAIGSPFGLSETVTQGIISAVHRNWQTSNHISYSDLIQTDTPVNPGNSGGPLINANGEVIGINSMIDSPVEGNVGIAFSIPINTVKDLLPQLEGGAQIQPAWLGISGVDVGQSNLTLPVPDGVVVVSVSPNSPASAAGLQGMPNDTTAGDIITAVDGKAINTMSQLASVIGGHAPGDKVALTVLRGTQTLTLNVTLGSWPASMAY